MARSVLIDHGAQVVAAPLRFAAFWAAIALPFLYLPLLFGGLQGQQQIVFGALFCLNAAALIAGHGYAQ